ncbi:alpha/beta fold hydrolase [Nocardia sp. NPDC051981]|uniref:alpha/beta fold hydrolase n=1 Tax=Nocardia sp. NPDC051981 TaxID=3155417 RepID=UPI0034309E63
MGIYANDAYCYGVDASCFIKLNGDEPLVESIWFRADTKDPARLELLRRAIIAVDLLAPSVIADYWLDCTGPVADDRFLHRYMRMLAQEAEDPARLPAGHRRTGWRLASHHLRRAGPGRSKKSADYSFEACLRDIDAVTAARDVRRPLIVGWSYGAALALQWAAIATCPFGFVREY